MENEKLRTTLGGFVVIPNLTLDPQTPIFDFEAGTVTCNYELLNQIQSRTSFISAMLPSIQQEDQNEVG